MRTNEQVIKEIMVGNVNVPISAKYIGDYEIEDIKDMIDTLPSASATTSGVVTTDAQTFAGSKTFNDNINLLVGDNNRFINFKYSTADTDSYSWRIGYLGTGSGDDNIFSIQTSKTGEWVDALKFTLPGDATFSKNVTAAKFVTSGGTSSQVVKGDGSLENENSLSVASASKLTTPRTISLTAGANGSGSFDGSQDACLIVNHVNDNYIRRNHWSTDYTNFAKNLSLADSSASEFSTNRLLYCKSSAFNIEYSNNAGSSWTKLNVSDEKIFNFVNTTQGFGLGNKSSNQTASNDRLRITINWDCGVYINLQRILIYLSTGGAKCIKCKYEYSYIGTEDTYIDKGTWDMTGWSGWNKLSVDKGFGNNNNVGSNIANIRLTFYFDEYSSTNYEGKVNSHIYGLRFIGETLYSNNTGYKLPQTGHLYDYNYLGDATFPANITSTKFITSGGTSSQFVRGNGDCTALTKSEVTTALGYTPPTNGLATTTTDGLMSKEVVANMETTAIVGVENATGTVTQATDKVSVSIETTIQDKNYITGDSNEDTFTTTFAIPQASTDKAGVMSSADKEKLDNLKPATLGQGYGTCTTGSTTAAKVVTLSSYELVTGGIVSVKFDNAVGASATMNINGKGAKPIYYRGSEIVTGVIGAGDVATFIYDGLNYIYLGTDNALNRAGGVINGELKIYKDNVMVHADGVGLGISNGAMGAESYIAPNMVVSAQFKTPNGTENQILMADGSVKEFSEIGGGMNISGTVNLTNGTFNTQNNSSLNSYSKVFDNMSVGEMRMYLVADSSGNLPSTTETSVTVPHDGVLSPAQIYFGKSAAFGVSVGDICVMFKRSSIFNVCRIIPLNDVKPANGDFPGADGLSTVWDKTRINKIDGIEWTANHVRDTYLPKNDRFPSRSDWLINVDNCIDNGVYPTCDAAGMNIGLVNNYVTLIVHRTSTADNGGYHTIEQTAYGRGADEGQIYKRIIFVKYDDSTQYGDWKRVDNNYSVATTEEDGLMSKTTAEAFNKYGGAITYLYDTEADVTSNNDGVNVHWSMSVDRTNYLTGESTADDAPSYVDFTIPLATDASAGVMSAKDKSKLNGMGNPLRYISYNNNNREVGDANIVIIKDGNWTNEEPGVSSPDGDPYYDNEVIIPEPSVNYEGRIITVYNRASEDDSKNPFLVTTTRTFDRAFNWDKYYYNLAGKSKTVLICERESNESNRYSWIVLESN